MTVALAPCSEEKSCAPGTPGRGEGVSPEAPKHQRRPGRVAGGAWLSRWREPAPCARPFELRCEVFFYAKTRRRDDSARPTYSGSFR